MASSCHARNSTSISGLDRHLPPSQVESPYRSLKPQCRIGFSTALIGPFLFSVYGFMHAAMAFGHGIWCIARLHGAKSQQNQTVFTVTVSAEPSALVLASAIKSQQGQMVYCYGDCRTYSSARKIHGKAPDLGGAFPLYIDRKI